MIKYSNAFFSSFQKQNSILKDAIKDSENFCKPTHIFEIKYSDDKNKKFDALKQQTLEKTNANPVSSINFHGTRMDNVYSILHIGLLTHLSKVLNKTKERKKLIFLKLLKFLN